MYNSSHGGGCYRRENVFAGSVVIVIVALSFRHFRRLHRRYRHLHHRRRRRRLRRNDGQVRQEHVSFNDLNLHPELMCGRACL